MPWRNDKDLYYGSMKNNFIPFAFGMGIVILLSLLPIYPLWVEGSEFTQSGESLYHELQFVSLHAYYEYAQYIRIAWSEATQVVYVLLAIVNPLVIILLALLAVRALRKWIT
jgi:hypothetical protein